MVWVKIYQYFYIYIYLYFILLHIFVFLSKISYKSQNCFAVLLFNRKKNQNLARIAIISSQIYLYFKVPFMQFLPKTTNPKHSACIFYSFGIPYCNKFICLIEKKEVSFFSLYNYIWC